MRVLGELYNYSVVSAPVIYELLYTVINYGHLKEAAKSGPGEAGKLALSVGEAPSGESWHHSPVIRDTFLLGPNSICVCLVREA